MAARLFVFEALDPACVGARDGRRVPVESNVGPGRLEKSCLLFERKAVKHRQVSC